MLDAFTFHLWLKLPQHAEISHSQPTLDEMVIKTNISIISHDPAYCQKYGLTKMEDIIKAYAELNL